MNSNPQTYIYVAELEKNKYYIGSTENPNFNIDCITTKKIIPATDSDTSISLEWCDIYRPIKLIEFIEQIDSFDVVKNTLKYMAKYGINNVRGGCFGDVSLSYCEYVVLYKILNECIYNCIYCNSPNHKYTKCPIILSTGYINGKENNDAFTIISNDMIE